MDKFLNPVDIVELPSSPGSPESGYQRIYAKSDGKLYRKTATGDEIEITNEQFNLAGNTLGVSSITGNPIVLNAGNNITLSGTSNSIVISAAAQTVDTNKAGTGVTTAGANIGLSGTLNTNGLSLSATVPAQTVQSQNRFNLTLSGNTAGVMAQVSSGTLSLAGGNNITLSQNGNAITISGANAPAQTYQPVAYSANGGSSTASTLNFANSNGLTFSNSNGSIVGSYTVPTIPGATVFSNSNNVSFGLNGSTVTATATFNQTNQTLSAAITGNTTGNTSGFSFDARSLTLQGLGAASVGISTSAGGSSVIISSPVQSVQTQPSGNIAGSGVTTAGANIGVSGTLNSNGLSLSATVPSQSVQTQNLHNLTISGNTAGVGAAVSSGTLSLAGGNNITLSQNGNAITISGANIPAQTVQPVAVSGSNGSFAYSTLSLGNSNGMTFYTTNGSIVGSYTVPTIPGATVFSNSNNVSFGLNGSTVTATATFAQSVQTQNLHNLTISGNSTSSGASGYANVSSGTLTLVGGNNITLQQDGNRVLISGPNVGGAQTGISGVIASNATFTSGTISFADGNGVSFGTAANQAISLTHGLQYTSNTSNITSNAFPTANTTNLAGSSVSSRVIGIVANTNNAGGGTSTLSGNVSFSNANGLSFYTSVGGAIVGSYTVPTSPSAYVSSINGSSGALSLNVGSSLSASTNGSSITFGLASNITTALQSAGNYLTTARASNDAIGLNTALTANGLSITANSSGLSINVPAWITTAAQSSQTLAFTLSGNSGTTNSSTIANGGFALAGGNNVTLLQSNNTISIAGAVGTGVSTAGANIGLSGTLSSNGLSLSATVPAQTVQPVGSFGISTGGNSVGTSGTVTNIMVFAGGNNITLSQATGAGGNTLTISGANQTQFVLSNSNGISFGTNGSTVTATVKTDYASSNHSHGNPTLALTNLSGTTGSASNGLTLSLSAAAQSVQVQTVSLSGNTVGASTVTGNAIVFQGGNNITLSGTNGTVIISAPNLGGGGADGGVGVSAGTNSRSTGTVTFANSNNVSFGMDTNGVITAAGGGAIAAGTQTATSGTLVFANSNNITFGMSGSSQITASYSNPANSFSLIGNTVGNSSVTGDAVYLSGGNNITLSGTSNTIVIQGADGGGANTYSTYIPKEWGSTGSLTLAVMGATTASEHFFPIYVSNNIAFNCIKMIGSLSFATTTVAASQSMTSAWGLYSENNDTLSLISSNSFSLAVSASSVSATLSYPNVSSSSGFEYTTVSASTTAQIHSFFGTVGYRVYMLPFSNSMSLTPGIYWLGLHQRYSSVGGNAGVSGNLIGNIEAPLASRGGMGFASSVATTNTRIRDPYFAQGAFTSTGLAGHSGSKLLDSAAVSGIGNTISVVPVLTFISSY